MVLHYSYRQIGMNTLSFTGLLRTIDAYTQVSACISAVKEGKFPLEIGGCEGSFGALLLAKLYNAQPGRYFVVVSQESDIAGIAADMTAAGLPFLRFPDWGATPYRALSPFSAIFGERIRVLSELVSSAAPMPVVIVSQTALLTALSPPDYIKSLLISIKPGEKIDTAALAALLVSYGYTRVPRVQVHGEFALRGEVLDIFLGGENRAGVAQACRILFDFDQVESIKWFDPFSQGTLVSGTVVPELIISPMREVIWTDDRIDALAANLAAYKEFSDGGKAIIEELIAKRTIAGEEMLFPLAFPARSSLLDYAAAAGTLVLIESTRLEFAQKNLHRMYQSLYAQSVREGEYLWGNTERKSEYPLPERLLLDFQTMAAGHKRIIAFNTIKSETNQHIHRITVSCDQSRSFFGNIDYLRDEFTALAANGWRIAVAAASDVQAARIQTILPEHTALSIMTSPLSAGFSLPEIKFMLVQEDEIFGRRKRMPHSLRTVRSSPIDTFVELNPGDYVVHINHGIGLFKGIERMNVNVGLAGAGFERDYIQLEYAGDETVFVPVEQVNLVQRYIGNEGQPPRLDTVGSKSWESRKNKVKSSVEDIAQKLLDLYSRRKQSQGFSFSRDSEWQTMFEAAFPFEETEDQLRCVEEIKQDMESSSPMDRLVCGDVGYGKTEVAVRACFKAVMGGKQVVFLAPTTILAEQHHEN
ncbi:MAG: DEAD/DEAH box helicase, partial [Treponema sp.]|nr:DEAD/DEAH box helicase [Treponema sp.]